MTTENTQQEYASHGFNLMKTRYSIDKTTNKGTDVTWNSAVSVLKSKNYRIIYPGEYVIRFDENGSKEEWRHRSAQKLSDGSLEIELIDLQHRVRLGYSITFYPELFLCAFLTFAAIFMSNWFIVLLLLVPVFRMYRKAIYKNEAEEIIDNILNRSSHWKGLAS